MEIQITEVDSKAKRRAFIHLPARIHQGHRNWVPPLYIDDWTFFNPQKNILFEHCDTIMLLALKNGHVVGRCMGIIQHQYNKDHHEKNARFAFMETWNDQEVFHALIRYIEDWAKAQGMEKLIGPLAFSDKDPQGFLIEGFDQPVAIASSCNFPYMVSLTENEGFTKMVDLVVYKIEIPEQYPPIYEKIRERFGRNNSKIRILSFKNRRQIRPLIRPVLRLLNATFIEIYGFTPFSEKEMDDFANRYLFLINPSFVKVAMNEHDEVIGTVIGMSDISKGIQKSKGYLFPFGIFHILRAGKRSNQLNLLLGAVDPRYQGRGLEVMMGIEMIESAKAEGKKIIDSHLELETNTKVRAEMERMGGVVYKRYRLFEKKL
jgi:GNAT superfamily N-acetyltransferase